METEKSQSRIGNPHSIELHIEELVLHGFAPGDRHRIGEAVELELARLVAEHGVTSPSLTDMQVDQLDGGAFQVGPGSRPEAIGTRVARAVHGTLRQ